MSKPSAPHPSKRAFPETSWTLALAAGDPKNPDSRRALQSLCEVYWYPLYAYVRRRGFSADEANDLTQEFFLKILSRSYIALADPDRGRFRSFLLAALRSFLADEWERGRAVKRGGAVVLPAFAIQGNEERYLREPSHNETPERIYVRRWARTLLDRVVEELKEEFTRHGRLQQFQELKPYLYAAGDAPYAVLAPRLGMGEASVRVTIHRLRRRFRDMLRAEVASTVADPADVDAELRFLIAALSDREEFEAASPEDPA